MSKGIVVQSLKSVAYYLNGKEKRHIIFVFILLVVASVLDVFGLASLVPIIIAASSPERISSHKYFGPVFNFFGFESEILFLVVLILSIFLFFLFKNIFTTWINVKQVSFTASLALNVIRRQFNKYSNLPYWYFNNEGSAKMVNNILTIPQFLVNSVIRPVLILFSEGAIIAIVVIALFIYKPLLFLFLGFILIPSSLLLYWLLKKKSEKIGNRLNQLRPKSYGILTDTFNGFTDLKLSDKLKHFRDSFIENQKEVQALEARAYLFALVPLKVIEMVAILGLVTIFLYVLIFQESAASLVTIVGLFVAAAYRLMPSVNRVLTSMLSLKQSSVFLSVLKAYREFEQIPFDPEYHHNLEFREDIRFRNLSFSFPEDSKLSLNKINLRVRKGEKIGLIGTSGSGKTTLMHILLRLYKEQKGELLIDSVPLTDHYIKAWHKMVGYVKQDVFLMDCSIKDNITLLDPEVDEGRLNYALEKAALKEFVNQLPEGADTLVGENGSKLSGGQRQRIGIARALYKNSQVLILDEATSALDTKTEREVNEAIMNLAQTDLTIFIIAHRITTLKGCDRIIEISNGEIIAERP